ncbi:hypothetical protein, partial [Hafnia paralvei]|uniref:hypothetical protein n=1 Tax=Hafnia paralvei TaxID=546367 RepID=UPI001D0DFDDF
VIGSTCVHSFHPLPPLARFLEKERYPHQHDNNKSNREINVVGSLSGECQARVVLKRTILVKLDVCLKQSWWLK